MLLRQALLQVDAHFARQVIADGFGPDVQVEVVTDSQYNVADLQHFDTLVGVHGLEDATWIFAALQQDARWERAQEKMQ